MHRNEVGWWLAGGPEEERAAFSFDEFGPYFNCVRDIQNIWTEFGIIHGKYWEENFLMMLSELLRSDWPGWLGWPVPRSENQIKLFNYLLLSYHSPQKHSPTKLLLVFALKLSFECSTVTWIVFSTQLNFYSNSCGDNPSFRLIRLLASAVYHHQVYVGSIRRKLIFNSREKRGEFWQKREVKAKFNLTLIVSVVWGEGSGFGGGRSK